MEYNIEVVPAIHSNLKLLFIECYPIKGVFNAVDFDRHYL